MITQHWVAPLPTGPSASERHPLVERDIVAHDARLADDDIHSLTNEERAADGCAGIDLAPRSQARHLRQQPGPYEPTLAVEPVGEAMWKDRMDAGRARPDIEAALGSGVVLEDGLNLFANSVGDVNRWGLA